MQTLIRTYNRLVEKTNVEHVRYLHEKVKWQERLIGIKGARGVGKTTLLLQHIKLSFPNRSEALYASLDNIWFSNNSLLEFVDYLYAHGVTHLFLDEVHRYPQWKRELKNIYDSYPDMQIVFTGSSPLEIGGAEADLSRRVRMYHMHGLSFREYLSLTDTDTLQVIPLDDILKKHQQISAEITAKMKVLPLFESYLKEGYYPFFKETADEDSYRERVQSMVSVAIDEDIASVGDITYETLQKAKKLLVTLAQTVPFTPKITTLCETLTTTRNQVMKLLTLLEQAELVKPLHCDAKKLKSVGKPDKMLLANTNLMSALASNVDARSVRETFISSMFDEGHTLNYPQVGDLMVDGKFLFEVGGRNKDFSQIKDIENSFVAADEIETGFGNKIPLWLFGMMY